MRTGQNVTNSLPLTLSDVTYAANGRNILCQVSLEIETGPRTVILGPNGAGKSVLLRICHGLITPREGSVCWHGSAIVNGGVRQAMVFQRPVMLRRSAHANIRYALRLNGTSKRKLNHLADEALARTGLSEVARTPAHHLSIGEQQRLALARAWVLKPEVLFLDEPTASLDPASTRAVEDIVRAIDRSGTKIIMTSHDLAQARRIAHEVIFLHKGKVIEDTSAAMFFESPDSPEAQGFLAGELLW